MTGPGRIQLSRAKGWRMPPNTVKVDRTTRFGNPFTEAGLCEAGYRFTTEEARIFLVACFCGWLRGSKRDWAGPESEAKRARLLDGLPTLRGKNLACWCKPGSLCHADVLLECVNADPEAKP